MPRLTPLGPLLLLAGSLLAWLVQFVGGLFWLFSNLPAETGWPLTLCFVELLNLAVGASLVVMLVRTLYWHPRRNAQTAAAVRKERQRIAGELHDLVGSQIVNALLLLDSPANRLHPAVRTLEQCMLDLRLLVEVMSDQKGDLAEKLAALRYRIQPVLDKRGICLTWIMDVDDGEMLPRRAHARELCRLVQEAVSNVLQHSRATHLTIELRPRRESGCTEWLLRVMDNGVGMRQQPGEGVKGHGVSNMRRRARRVGARMSIVSEEGMGTEIVVIVDTMQFAPTVIAST